jgi:hypothetical protein
MPPQLHTESLFMSLDALNDKGTIAMRKRILCYFQKWPLGRALTVLYTHADVNSGNLCDSYGKDGVTALHSTVEEICSYFLGERVLDALKAHTAPCGLLILACGPAMGPGHIASVQKLVKAYVQILYGLICRL